VTPVRFRSGARPSGRRPARSACSKQRTRRRLTLYTLTDKCEQGDNCAGIYNKSLLYLISNAFEARARIPVLRPDGEPILGMAKFLEGNATVKSLLASKRMEWITAPNDVPPGKVGASRSASHSGFDDDAPTITSTIAAIVGGATAPKQMPDFEFKQGVSHTNRFRMGLNRVTEPGPDNRR
jgi:hypothetical protein